MTFPQSSFITIQGYRILIFLVPLTPFPGCRFKDSCTNEGSLLRGNLFLLPSDHCLLVYLSFFIDTTSCPFVRTFSMECLTQWGSIFITFVSSLCSDWTHACYQKFRSPLEVILLFRGNLMVVRVSAGGGSRESNLLLLKLYFLLIE